VDVSNEYLVTLPLLPARFPDFAVASEGADLSILVVDDWKLDPFDNATLAKDEDSNESSPLENED
jgi:hypothetical protein